MSLDVGLAFRAFILSTRIRSLSQMHAAGSEEAADVCGIGKIAETDGSCPQKLELIRCLPLFSIVPT